MPNKDKTGPKGQGQGTGRGMGDCKNQNHGFGFGRGQGAGKCCDNKGFEDKSCSNKNKSTTEEKDFLISEISEMQKRLDELNKS